ncbi:MAG: DUF1804 family protein [Burkholderiales bacterium]|nr:DUF1804 family protein [Burkholderiales bacterium]
MRFSGTFLLRYLQSTINRWKKTAFKNGDDWDKARAAARLSGQGAEAVTVAVLEDFVLLFQSTLADVKSDQDITPLQKAEVISRLSDAYTKTINAAAKGNPKLDKLSFAADILRDLVQFIQTHYPQHAQAMEQVLVPFGEEIGKRYG